MLQTPVMIFSDFICYKTHSINGASKFCPNGSKDVLKNNIKESMF